MPCAASAWAGEAMTEAALALARLAEKATPEVLETALALFRECCWKGDDGVRCGRERLAHPQKDHPTWVPYYEPSEAMRLVEVLTALSRHEGRADKGLGLDKKQEAVQVPWLIGVDVGAFKRMNPAQQEEAILRAMGGGQRAIEAEVIVNGHLPGQVSDGADSGEGKSA